MRLLAGFKLEMAVDNFDAEDIDITVEGGKLNVIGEREIQRGGSSSKRQFRQSFDLPSGIDVEKITSQINAQGMLVISAPSLNKPGEGEKKYCKTTTLILICKYFLHSEMTLQMLIN